MKKNILSFILSLALVFFTAIPAAAVDSRESSKDSSENLTPTTVVDAANNGAYKYNVATKEQTFASVATYARSSSNRSMPQYIPNGVSAEQRDVTDPDDREKVTNVTGRYTNTVLLVVEFPDRTVGVSGWMIGPKTVATAGHCVYSYTDGGWADRITVYPGATGGNHPYGSAEATNMWVGGDYLANDPNYEIGVYDDWGVIELGQNIGDQTGWLGLIPANSYSAVSKYEYQSNGYPADLDNDGVQEESLWMYTCYGSFTGTRPRFLPTMYMNLDIAGGQSGSPIYRYSSDYGYSAQAIAVGGDGRTISVLINDWLYDFYMSVR